MGAVAERRLFATKGCAAPGPVERAHPVAGPAAGVMAPAPEQQPALPLADEPAGGHDAQQARAEAPAGSLLDFKLRGGTARAALTDDLRAALKPRAATPPGAGVAEAAETAARPATSARLDRPLFPQGPRSQPAPPAALPAPVVTPAPSVWRTVVPALAAVIGIAVVGWIVTSGGGPESTAVSPAESPAAVDDVDAPTPAAEEGNAPDGGEALAGNPATAHQPDPDPVAAPTPAAAEAAPAPAPASVAAAPEMPSFDIVRVTSDAPPVIAGRAAPGAELIVLDNGSPLGTVVADANGEWALVSDAPLSPGRHELSLAITTSEGTVVIEQAETAPLPPAATPPAPPALPTPPEKPKADASEAAPNYLVQLASVPATADAELEWARLQNAYPGLLAGREAEFAVAEIGGRGTFYRVRTGPFDRRDAARKLCQALNAAGQECLVVRKAAP